MSDVSKKIIEKINKEKIKPIPKWHFILKDSFIWGLFFANLIFGAIGFAIIIFLFVNNDSVSDISLTRNIFQWIVLSIPFVWIILTVLFTFIAYYNLKNTQEGYKYSTFKILILNIVIILILGTILYFSGCSENLNNLFSKSIPNYSKTMDTRYKVWMRPTEGYLAGEIIKIDESNSTIELVDMDGEKWVVKYENVNVKPAVNFKLNEKIKILGKAFDESIFEASEIRPWEGKRNFLQEK